MKMLFTFVLLIGFSSWFVHPALAAPSLDELLTTIKEDIKANRLSSPDGNNALMHINQFRQQAPFDFRVVPLVYQWGEAYVTLAQRAMDNRQYSQAYEYLDKVYHVAVLTPGLEEAQKRLDALYDATQAQSKAQKPSQEDLQRQRQLEAVAAKEKAKVEAENRRKAQEEKRLAQEAKLKAEEERKRRQEAERLRREELAKEQAAEKTVEEKAQPAVVQSKPKRTLPSMFNQKTTKSSSPDTAVSSNFVMRKDKSAKLASFDVPVTKVRSRDLSIKKDLAPICQAVVDKNASIVIHAAGKTDYRWLIVRMTLCVRDIDRDFRLRYSQQNNPRPGKISISLHPARDSSLIRILHK